jgi:hypothetical protein
LLFFSETLGFSGGIKSEATVLIPLKIPFLFYFIIWWKESHQFLQSTFTTSFSELPTTTTSIFDPIHELKKLRVEKQEDDVVFGYNWWDHKMSSVQRFFLQNQQQKIHSSKQKQFFQYEVAFNVTWIRLFFFFIFFYWFW